MIPTQKFCPACNSRFLVDPSLSPSLCPSCGQEYKVNPALRDTDRTRGGFTIELTTKEVFQDKLLAFIYEHPASCAEDASMKLKKACNTIHTYVRQLEASGLVIVDRSRRIHRFSCSSKYNPPERLLEPQKSKTCVFCGKHTNVLVKGKCESCIAQQKLIWNKFRELNREAERNINEMQRCKNSQVTA